MAGEEGAKITFGPDATLASVPSSNGFYDKDGNALDATANVAGMTFVYDTRTVGGAKADGDVTGWFATTALPEEPVAPTEAVLTGVNGNCVYKSEIDAEAKTVTVEVKTANCNDGTTRTIKLTAGEGATIGAGTMDAGFSFSNGTISIANTVNIDSSKTVKVTVSDGNLASTTWTITIKPQTQAQE